MIQVTKNAEREAFKKALMGVLKNAEAEAVITDSALRTLASNNGLSLPARQIQGCVRELESTIGHEYSIRLLRLRNEGYRVVAGDNQYFKADSEGKKKLRKVFKKQEKRLSAIDLDEVSDELRGVVVAKTLAYSGLAQIALAALDNKKLTPKDVGIITAASNELKALAYLKKSGY
jgi:hypothetical protein